MQRETLGVIQILGIDVGRQNTGGMVNERGQYVPFGVAGNSDLTGMFPERWGWAGGRKLDIEIKREGFDPRRQRGKARERWERQLDRLRLTNDNGGVGIWTDDALWLHKVLLMIRDDGAAVRIGEDEWPELYRR